MSLETVKNVTQEIVLLVGVAGACIAAFKAVREMRAATKQRHEELRWRRAQAAKDVIHDIHQDVRASAAVTMLDWDAGQHAYEVGEGKELTISYAKVLTAVSCDAASCTSEKDVYIRDCMDWLLYYLDRIEHYIRTEYIDFMDVESVFRQYAMKLLKDLDKYRPLLTDKHYSLAECYLRRYPAPVQPEPATSPARANPAASVQDATPASPRSSASS